METEVRLALSKNKQYMFLFCEYEDRVKAKKAGGTWKNEFKGWRYAFDLMIYEHIVRLFHGRVKCQAGFLDYIEQKRIEQKQFLIAKEESKKNEDIDYDPGLRLNGVNPLYAYQKHGVKCAMMAEGNFLIADSMGLGKMTINSTPVMTSDGYIEIGNMKVGDRVYGQDGELHNVVGVYPQGVNALYRVTFSDGTYADAGLDHLWNVRRPKDKVRNIPWRTVTTEDLIGDLKFTNGRRKWRIPLVEPINYDEKELLINPYVLGVLIADGSIVSCTKYVPGNLEVPKLVEERLQNFMLQKKGVDYGTSTAYIISYPKHRNNVYTDYIRSVNLNVTGEYKFIPNEYMFGSIAQRKELLAGLLDSDGTVRGARTRYSTSSKQLADQIITLTQSLGGIATCSIFKGRLRTRDGRTTQELDNYQVNVRTKFNPFLRESNRIKWKKSSKLVKTIESIEYLKDDEATCITVDAEDHLFVIKDYIVTHNSIQALGVFHQLKKEGKAKTALIVCPSSLKYNWLNEISKFTELTSLVIDGKVAERYDKWFEPNIDIKIVNYEILARDLFYFPGKKTKMKDNRIPNYSQVVDNYIDMCVIDEVHYIASHNALRSKACKAFKTNYRLGLTGTPLDGKLEQFHSIFEFIKPGIFPAKTRFLEKHAIFNFWGQVERYIKIDEFKEKIAPYYVRRLKKEVLKDLPEKIYKDVYVELSAKARTTYNQIAKRKHELTEDEEIIVTIIRCRQFCDMPEILGLDLKSDKLDVLKEILEEVVKENNKKVIIFSQYKECTKILERMAKEWGYKVCTLETGSNRFESGEIFNKDNSYDLMIMTDAGSVGLTLIGNETRPCNTVVMYDQNYSPAVNMQRSDRAHRIGVLDTVSIINLICKNTIEERVKYAIDRKHKFSSNVLDEELSEMSLGTALSPAELFKML